MVIVKLTHNLWLIGISLIIYWLIVLLVGFAVEVIDILKSIWAKVCAEWLNRKLLELFSRYRKKYLKQLYYQFRDFDVRGMSIQGPFTLEIDILI